MHTNDIAQLHGSSVIDLTGDKIGKVEDIYLDNETNQPEWVLVDTGLFGRSTFIPLHGANLQEDGVQVPIEKAAVKDAPAIETGRELSQTEEAELYRYYGFEYSEARSDSGLPEGTDQGQAVGYDTSGPTTDTAMTRSEEQLTVGTVNEAVGRVRLRKYIVTENVTQTIPVQREEVRIEREPITDATVGDALEGPAISEEEHEVVLHQERPVVQKDTVPVERVRLDTETVTEEATVSEELRKEQIDVDGDQR